MHVYTCSSSDKQYSRLGLNKTLLSSIFFQRCLLCCTIWRRSLAAESVDANGEECSLDDKEQHFPVMLFTSLRKACVTS